MRERICAPALAAGAAAMANCTGRSIGRSAGRTIPACDGDGKRVSSAFCGTGARGVTAEKAFGSSGTGPPHARTSCRGWAVMGWLPTLACGTGADGVTESRGFLRRQAGHQAFRPGTGGTATKQKATEEKCWHSR